LAFALKEGRTVVTLDKDFGELAVAFFRRSVGGGCGKLMHRSRTEADRGLLHLRHGAAGARGPERCVRYEGLLSFSTTK